MMDKKWAVTTPFIKSISTVETLSSINKVFQQLA